MSNRKPGQAGRSQASVALGIAKGADGDVVRWWVEFDAATSGVASCALSWAMRSVADGRWARVASPGLGELAAAGIAQPPALAVDPINGRQWLREAGGVCEAGTGARIPLAATLLAISRDGRRLYAIVDDTLVEWQLAGEPADLGPRILGPVPNAVAMCLSPAGLLVLTRDQLLGCNLRTGAITRVARLEKMHNAAAVVADHRGFITLASATHVWRMRADGSDVQSEVAGTNL